jgi:hypothetical protein
VKKWRRDSAYCCMKTAVQVNVETFGMLYIYVRR